MTMGPRNWRVALTFGVAAWVGAFAWSCSEPAPAPDIEPLLRWRAADLGATEPQILAQVDSALGRLRAAAQEGERGDALADRLGEVAMLHQLYRHSDRALMAYDLASGHQPDEPRWPYYEALIRHEKGDLAGAVAALERCLATGTDAFAPRVRLAETLMIQGDTEAAAEHFAELLEVRPDSVRVRVAWAEAQLALGRAEAAREVLEALHRAQPEARRVRLALGRARRAAGDGEGARALLAQLPPLSPADRRLDLDDPWVQELAAANRSSEAARNKARALMSLGLPAAAVVALRTAVERQPERAAYWTDLGTAQERLGQLAEAKRSFGRALEIDPDYLPALAQLGALEQKQGRYGAALAAFDRILARDPHRPRVLFLKAEAHRLAGDVPAAIDAFHRSLELDPTDERALVGLAAAQFQLGDREAAARAVSRGLAARPDSFWFRSLSLRLCALDSIEGTTACTGGLDEAELLFRARPTAFAAETLAMTLAARGDFEAARRWQAAVIEGLDAAGDAAGQARERDLAYRDRRRDITPFLPSEFSAARVAIQRPE